MYPQLSASSVSSSSLCLSPIMAWCPRPVQQTCVDRQCPGWISTAPCLLSDQVSQTNTDLNLCWIFLNYVYCNPFFFPFFSVVLSSLRLLSTTTAILTDPSLLPEQAALAVTQAEPPSTLDHSLLPPTQDSLPPMWRSRAEQTQSILVMLLQKQSRLNVNSGQFAADTIIHWRVEMNY